ncbi:MAG: chromosome segregation protein SMC [Rhodocyclaceae bacterium]|nr:chromosome segregation protein SMC [Rhodocyclaceae bacterium]
MRLTKIKLAGFKSFVEPTTVLFPGQLVGVVGPNGCGKSNIIDAVRWVLGESKAAELRGESIQDVIFKGSATRKEVGRASVELFFDNTSGRIKGQWGQYAEITVKRVLDREGNSNYYINNLHVRRRDVVDLFLGTGLGPRAYAIISQGTISRIIEAKPDELRGFLEEAAGVTRYKERRKETEGRLADARENLARVDDIRNELETQVARLEAQAEVARRYRELQQRLSFRQNLLWLKKRQDAEHEVGRLSREIAALEVAIEADTAALRACETELVRLREAHFAASDALHAAQAKMYEANAEVRRCEAELSHRRETRLRLEARLAQLTAQSQHWQEEENRLRQEGQRWQELLEGVRARIEEANARCEEATQRLMEREAALQSALERVETARKEVFELEQKLRLAENHAAHAQRSLEAIQQRRRRLEQEEAALVAPDPHLLALAEAAEQEAQEAFQAAEERLRGLVEREPGLKAALAQARDEGRKAHREAAAAQARLAALNEMQQRSNADLSYWLAEMGLSDAPVLWRALSVEPGWERAVEAVLGARLSAVGVDSATLRKACASLPQATVALAVASDTTPEAPPSDALLAKVRCHDARWQAVVAEWLAGVRIAEDDEMLFAGPHLRVDRAGRMGTPHGLVVYAFGAEAQGILERQRQIEALTAECARLDEAEALQRAREETLLGELSALADALEEARRALEAAQNRRHACQIEALKRNEAKARYEEKRAQLARDREELARLESEEADRLMAAQTEGADARARLEDARERLEEALAHKRRVEVETVEARALEKQATQAAQEAAFAERECLARIDDNARALETSQRQQEQLAEERKLVTAELANAHEEDLGALLQAALEKREEIEAELIGRREALEEAGRCLREKDEERLRLERALEPARTRLAELRLREQAAQLAAAQYAERLAENGVDEAQKMAELAAELTPNLRESALNNEITRLTKEIEALGPVNLAALEELEAARRRKGFLDEQAADLTSAIATLEDAIRRIDRETREQLKETFETVNRHFGALFPELFGGGEARLILTGEEILDAGVQIMAQPPGKRNSTIHLLSGGEKALAAIALVFALFQLNPAPFCLLDEVDAPLDDANTLRYCEMVRRMSRQTQFIFITHSKITMELAEQLVGVTMQEQGVSRIVEVDLASALSLAAPEEAA